MSSRRSALRVFILMIPFAFALEVGAAAAQITSSTITGTVFDPTGAVIPGAIITVRHVETSLTRNAPSGPDGRFVFAALPIGGYEIRAEMPGFQPLLRKDVRTTVGETTVINVALQVEPIATTITLDGGEFSNIPLVNTTSGELSYLVSGETIQELPLNGRNYTDLAFLQPGVVAYPHRDAGSVVAHGMGASINGQDPRSNVYLLDGTPQNDFTNGPAGSAAGTVLGMESIQEFRVETNAYSAEYGRNSGGQINAISRAGSNNFHGSAYWFHRNDNFDARNFFDPAEKPEFIRNQGGLSAGGPLKREKAFLFGAWETLRERLGRTILTVVPDDNARLGILPDATTNPCVNNTMVAVSAAVQPYLAEYPVANGALVRDANGCPTGLANYSFLFGQRIDQDFGQIRFDQMLGNTHRLFARYTYDGAAQALPTDFPQFPRAFLSRNQFLTLQYEAATSPHAFHTARFGFSRTRVGQDVEANTSQALAPFVSGRTRMGSIDVGGLPRFGTQSSVNVQLTQNVFGGEYSLALVRGKHFLKIGSLVERYQDNLFNPTFSLGIWTFSNLRSFLTNAPQRFIGLTAAGELDRYWRFTLFGFYVQNGYRVHRRLTLNAGLRYEFATTPKEIYGRDAALINLTDPAPTLGQLYQNPTYKNISPRLGLAWDVFGDGKTSLRSGYAWLFNTNNHQNLIVTITNPPFTPRIVIGNAAALAGTFPMPNLAAGAGNSIRPIEWDIKSPNVHHWNLNVQREFWGQTMVMLGYAGSRGVHLWRNTDFNIPAPLDASVDAATCFPAPVVLAQLPAFAPGTPCWAPSGMARPNPAFTTIELKKSDGNSWYNAMLVEARKRWRGLHVQSSYTWSRNIDTTQASTFFSDATNGSTTALPEPDFPGFSNYNKGLADYHAKHNWVTNFTWHMPFGDNAGGSARLWRHGWQLAGIASLRSGSPLTVFVQRNVSRSLFGPSLAPQVGFDRVDMAPGFTAESAVTGNPNAYFNPVAFVLPRPGLLGNLGRNALIGPNLRTFDLALTKDTGFRAWNAEANLQFRVEAFNIFNRTNFSVPALLAFGGACPPAPIRPDGTCSDDTPLGSLGRIRSTVTSSRQIQLGLRLSF